MASDELAMRPARNLLVDSRLCSIPLRLVISRAMFRVAGAPPTRVMADVDSEMMRSCLFRVRKMTSTRRGRTCSPLISAR